MACKHCGYDGGVPFHTCKRNAPPPPALLITEATAFIETPLPPEVTRDQYRDKAIDLIRRLRDALDGGGQP